MLTTCQCGHLYRWHLQSEDGIEKCTAGDRGVIEGCRCTGFRPVAEEAPDELIKVAEFLHVPAHEGVTKPTIEFGHFFADTNETDVWVNGILWRCKASFGDAGFVISGWRIIDLEWKKMPPEVADAILKFLLEREASFSGV